MELTLNELYLSYLAGDLSRSDFEGSLYNYLVNNHEKTCLCHWEKDQYEDFVSWFYPRLKRSVESYKEIGASFEAFLTKYILVSSREYRVRTTTNAVTEYSAWSARVSEMYAHEEPPVYIHKDAKNIINELTIDKKGRKNTRRILALILKCYYYISEDFAVKIARTIGIDSKELLDMLAKIRKIRQKNDDDFYHFKERVYCQFYRCIVYDKRLSLIPENTPAHDDLKRRLDKARERLNKMRKRMAKIRIEATNKQVAEIIGTKKGTVDSSLHQLRTMWEKLSKKADLN